MITESTQSHFQSQFDLSIYLRRAGGASAAVVSRGTAPWSAAWAPNDEPISPGDRFLTYSLTKTFIACIIMQLVEQGSIDLDGLLGMWLPELPFAHQITIRQILNHTSGLPDYGGMEAYQQSLKQCPADPWTDEDFISYTCGYRLRSTPGTMFKYSNIGYLYLRLLLEAVTGLKFADAARERIFHPLALRSTSVHTNLQEQLNLLPSWSRYLGHGEPVDVRETYHPGWVSHGVIASTALDVATFYSALFSPDESLISIDSLTEMKELHPVKEPHRYFRNAGYGLGLMGDQRHTGNLYGHTGSGPGYAAAAYVIDDPFDDPITAVVLVNTESVDMAEGMVQDLLNIARDI